MTRASGTFDKSQKSNARRQIQARIESGQKFSQKKKTWACLVSQEQCFSFLCQSYAVIIIFQPAHSQSFSFASQVDNSPQSGFFVERFRWVLLHKVLFSLQRYYQPSQMSKVVYKASCWDCQDFYIGKTKRRLPDRKTEHLKVSQVPVMHLLSQTTSRQLVTT